MKLFMLPYAGGSSHCYRELSSHLPEYIEPVPLDLPGRGKRIREPLLADMNLLVRNLFQDIAPLLDEPYAFYGHSMGALLSYLLCLQASAEQYSLPHHLFVSGHPGPVCREPKTRYHKLPKEKFLDEVLGMGGTPPDVAASKELLDFFEPILRADFAAIENYDHQQAPPLNVPLTVMMGSEENFDRNQALSWHQMSLHPLQFKMFSGGHFFVLEHWESIGNLISTTLMEDETSASLSLAVGGHG